MLNLAYINNYLFLFFFLKKGLTGTKCLKEENTPPIRKKNGDAHTLSMPQATCRFRVLWILRVRAREGVREVHNRSRTGKHLLFARIDA